jgi:hypothetical protein
MNFCTAIAADRAPGSRPWIRHLGIRCQDPTGLISAAGLEWHGPAASIATTERASNSPEHREGRPARVRGRRREPWPWPLVHAACPNREVFVPKVRPKKAPSTDAVLQAPAKTAGPDVIVDFLFDDGLLSVALQNLGDAPAFDVQVRFDKPFHGADGERDLSALHMFKRTPFLGPRRTIRSFIDRSDAYFLRKEPTLLTVKILFTDAAGTESSRIIKHDLGIYEDITIVNRSTPPQGDDRSHP